MSSNPMVNAGLRLVFTVAEDLVNYYRKNKKIKNQCSKISGNSLLPKKNSLKTKFSNNFYLPNVEDIKKIREKIAENEF